MTGINVTHSDPAARRCACCSSPASPDSDLCTACLAELDTAPTSVETPSAPEPEQDEFTPRLIDLETVPGALSEEHGFTRVNWKSVHEHLVRSLSQDDYTAGWTEAECHWLHMLQADLGGGYRVHASRNFVLLSDFDESRRRAVLQFCERAWDFITSRLPGVITLPPGAKTPVIILGDHDDYLAYTAHFCPEGVSASSSGMCIWSGSVHIVSTGRESHALQHILAHELAHAAVPHLSLPVWLNEGLAMTSEREAVGFVEPLVDAEKTRRHKDFWDGNRIQSFWAGTSFNEPGDSQELSYNLAEVLVQLSGRDGQAFPSFVTNSRTDDAGQTAALDHLGVCLGEMLSQFLGPADWRPNRKVIAELHRKQMERYAAPK